MYTYVYLTRLAHVRISLITCNLIALSSRHVHIWVIPMHTRDGSVSEHRHVSALKLQKLQRFRPEISVGFEPLNDTIGLQPPFT